MSTSDEFRGDWACWGAAVAQCGGEAGLKARAPSPGVGRSCEGVTALACLFFSSSATDLSKYPGINKQAAIKSSPGSRLTEAG